MQPISVCENDSVKRTLTDVETAARFMLEKWPKVDDTDLYQAARESALDALIGASFVEPFRFAFIAAAERRDIGVRGWRPSAWLTCCGGQWRSRIEAGSPRIPPSLCGPTIAR
ncbi:DUF982 domain-containing protein [Ancylobacter defluvii]|uniref:DUF982 domain-containing protein n=1 Tax=Ancylobacter defluvii TaxID=1282440 RepID=A0A9W6JVS3_9HYPH|nr:DUF982 domain-containing protein [Ancylobacter defluvii]GLK82774.1 hypothetical protein GCM10017653_08430 [Ancylobacter defluvii]